jgi:hypothetical protein
MDKKYKLDGSNTGLWELLDLGEDFFVQCLGLGLVFLVLFSFLT